MDILILRLVVMDCEATLDSEIDNANDALGIEMEPEAEDREGEKTDVDDPPRTYDEGLDATVVLEPEGGLEEAVVVAAPGMLEL